VQPEYYDGVVLASIADRVATVTLNRSESRNALNSTLTRGLYEAIADAGDDPDVDVVVLTGADPAFCAGVDLKELTGESAPAASRADLPPLPGRDTNGLHRFFPVIEKPIIGAINGVAVTGGFEVALQCTFLVASDKARFADTHSRVGIMPGGGVTVLMAQSIGVRRAIELSITGNFVDAAEAHRLGLVNHVVPHEQLMPFTRKLAADIVSNDQKGVRRLLQNYRAIANAATLDEAHLLEGYMAEMWLKDGIGLSTGRRESVMERGRDQQGG
jgi:enoyl-CoA hydratase